MATKAETADTRNLHWKQNNVGSTLLQKMGWKEGQALGRKSSSSNNKDGDNHHSGEGLKITKRPDGLGLGADQKALQSAESNSHASFSQLLADLNQEHAPKKAAKSKKRSSDTSSSSKNKKKKKRKKETVFATNKITNSRVRQSKFASKSATDMACIFGKEYSSGEIADQTLQNKRHDQKRKRKEEKKKRRKEKSNSGEE